MWLFNWEYDHFVTQAEVIMAKMTDQRDESNKPALRQQEWHHEWYPIIWCDTNQNKNLMMASNITFLVQLYVVFAEYWV